MESDHETGVFNKVSNMKSDHETGAFNNWDRKECGHESGVFNNYVNSHTFQARENALDSDNCEDPNNVRDDTRCTEETTVHVSMGRDHCGIGWGGGNPLIEQVKSEPESFTTCEIDEVVGGTKGRSFEEAIVYSHAQVDNPNLASTGFENKRQYLK